MELLHEHLIPQTSFDVVLASNILMFDCADSFNLLVNNGAAAGQVIFHVSYSIYYHIYQWDKYEEDIWTPHVRSVICFCVILIFSPLFFSQTHIHIIPRKASDCLWTSEVILHFALVFSHCKSTWLRGRSVWFCELLQSLRRRQLNFDQEAHQLVERVREEMSLSNTSEESKGQESGLSWIYVLRRIEIYIPFPPLCLL